MIVDGLKLILSPLILVMDLAYSALRSIIGSAGLSIVLLSIAVTILTYPLRAWALKVERRIYQRKLTVDEKIATATTGLKGEQKFRVTESIYMAHGYHPIQSIALGLPLFVMLPFLLSALFLFSSNASLTGVPFLFIPDLSEPDGQLAGINVMPVIMTAITLVDSRIRFGADCSALGRFLAIALVLFALVYSFASAIVLYWIVSNLIVLFTLLLRRLESLVSRPADR